MSLACTVSWVGTVGLGWLILLVRSPIRKLVAATVVYSQSRRVIDSNFQPLRRAEPLKRKRNYIDWAKAKKLTQCL